MQNIIPQRAYQCHPWPDTAYPQAQTFLPSNVQRAYRAAPAQSPTAPAGVTSSRDTVSYQPSAKRRRLNPRCSRVVVSSSTQEPAPNGSSFSESTAAKVLARYGRSQQALKRGLPPVDWHRYHLQILFVDRCEALLID